PVALNAPAFVKLAAGWDHTCAQTADGSMYCWGGFNYSATPTLSFKSEPFDTIYAGGNVTCGLKDQATAYCWGSNQHGQLGTIDMIGSLTPRAVAGDLRFRQLDGYYETTCGLTTDGKIYCWGAGFFGGCS